MTFVPMLNRISSILGGCWRQTQDEQSTSRFAGS
jgi:hypothetical protein